MRIIKIAAIALAMLALGGIYHPPATAVEQGVKLGTEEAAPVDESMYITVFWLGKAENQCTVRESLMMDSQAECEADYPRAETEIKDLVAKKAANSWKWGLFDKCRKFPDMATFEAEMPKYKKKCSGM